MYSAKKGSLKKGSRLTLRNVDKGERIVISCGMLADELKSVYEQTNSSLHVIWIRRGMHNFPADLKKTLQRLINENQDKEAILLTFGLCGNSTLGITSEHTKLVIPRFHDCIHQLLLDNSRNQNTSLEKNQVSVGHYYLTRGWTLDREEIYQQSRFILQKYGENMGREILGKLYENYDEINVIDTGAYSLENVEEHAKKCGSLLNKNVKTIPGSTIILKKLLTGNWDEDFIVLNPKEILCRAHFYSRGQ